MNHTLNWLHQRGINIEVDDNVEVIQNDEYIIIEEVKQIKEETK